MILFQKNDVIVAVELKLANWKKALIQAQNYQFGADFVYMVFPSSKCSLVLEKTTKKLQQKGIGLLSVDEQTEEVTVLVPAKQSVFLLGKLSKKEIINREKRRYQRKRL
jgi:hypothetical protein